MRADILHGDCRETLATLPAESVQCCVTSPPYFGLRDYGHEGQIGLEKTPQRFVEQLVYVFREVRRVLRADGVVWLNLGDSYATPPSGQAQRYFNGQGFVGERGEVGSARRTETSRPKRGLPEGLKPKDIIGIPWRVAFALQADGWYLRQDIIWHKPNPMPESVRDRCTKAHEYVFLLSKSERYFYDADAIKTKSERGGEICGTGPKSLSRGQAKGANVAASGNGVEGGFVVSPEMSNRRSVWSIPTVPYAEAHFATFPTELPRLCILAGSRAGDTILDPFAGSGTTLQVALELGRAAVGCELNADYVHLIERRLGKTTLGLPLEVAA